MHHAELACDPQCSYHTAYQDVVELPYTSRDLTASALLQQAENDMGQPAIVELGRDFLVSLSCPACRRQDNIATVVARIPETSILCPSCGAARETEIVSRLDGTSPCTTWSLQALGVPRGEMLAARAGTQWRLYECTGDVTTWWEAHVLRAERERKEP